MNKKSVDEIMSLLVREIFAHINEATNRYSQYYNESLGDCSFLLAALLDVLFASGSQQWDNEIGWFDDSLITGLVIEHSKVSLSGVIIWGKHGTTEQWVEPFDFSINLDYMNRTSEGGHFLYGSRKFPEITYHEFKSLPGHFEISEPEWKYSFVLPQLNT